jgi:hypothetical protein
MACLLPWRSSPRALRSALPSSLAAALPQLGSAPFGAHLPASQPSVFPGRPARIAPNFQRRGRPLCSSPSNSYGAPTLLPYFFLKSAGRSLLSRAQASFARPCSPLAGSAPSSSRELTVPMAGLLCTATATPCIFLLSAPNSSTSPFPFPVLAVAEPPFSPAVTLCSYIVSAPKTNPWPPSPAGVLLLPWRRISRSELHRRSAQPRCLRALSARCFVEPRGQRAIDARRVLAVLRSPSATPSKTVVRNPRCSRCLFSDVCDVR